ncbi:hypothetical protein DL991_25575 [Amycolatopsis sp. WAC 01375]|uniref:hypothetical protein n=1 Tax=unclassified Amycolatopsis TaxID=2618356 RepID=UPI000F7987DA|nr:MULTISPECIES: hypothetical protein [unclassified Amycolatopsis]RSM76564.1 hypothetical protein DL991_25575 [Amycolatopsis sp. WAC 01375]RSN33213.1 hypothetical protein DL990_14520 [Amycolatopsis sp. WAC 01416]
MIDFEAVPDELSRAGDRLHDITEMITRQPALKFKAMASEAGDPVLVAALESFQEASAHSVAVLAEDVWRLGGRLGEAARGYRNGEEAAIEKVKAIEAAESPAPRAIVFDSGNANTIQAVLG